MDEQGVPKKNQTEKGSIQEVKAGTDNFGRIGIYLVRKAEAHLELNMARDIKNKSNEKGFHRYISGKRKTRENVCTFP